MIGYYGYTMLLTYLNVVSAMAGIYLALNQNIKYAVICLIISGVCDAFDGIVARSKKNRTDREKSYGIQIDSLADVVGFGILPVIIGYSLGLNQTRHIIIMSVYILAALIRLAYFNATEIEMQRQNIKRTHYIGLPVTCAAIIFPLVYICAPLSQLSGVYSITLVITAAAFLVKIKVPKVRFDDLFMKFLYNTAFGRAILKLLISVFVSKLAGWVLSSPISRIFIGGYIKNSNIDMSEYEEAKYRSFNDFFIREIKQGCRSFSGDMLDLPAPCDGKLTAYSITTDSLFHIKKSVYDINGLLQDNELASEFMGGICLVFRLTPDDYHRYCFVDDGEILLHKKIKGVFHTVRPIALGRYKVFTQNAREYTVMQTKNFGKVIQIEVGAMFVGKISNLKTEGVFTRGEKKGVFEFGGSTVMMLFQKDAVLLDETIFLSTASDKETVVKMGCKIGRSAI